MRTHHCQGPAFSLVRPYPEAGDGPRKDRP
jgi:hypothetical protein